VFEPQLPPPDPPVVEAVHPAAEFAPPAPPPKRVLLGERVAYRPVHETGESPKFRPHDWYEEDDVLFLEDRALSRPGLD